ARRGDTKAINKLFELYQVRIFSGEQLAKMNRTLASSAAALSGKGERGSKDGGLPRTPSTTSAMGESAKRVVKQGASKRTERRSGRQSERKSNKLHSAKKQKTTRK
ncbi:MAG: hypothetical protein ACK4VP_08635, partial [Nitrospira sp.]